MGLWIRSQDKTKFIKVEILDYDYDEKEITKETGRTIKLRGIKQPEKEVIGFVEKHYVLANGCRVATYSTEEKAMKVLDIIQNRLIHSEDFYQMPQDEDVI